MQSQVYYMLTRDRPVNYLHRLAPDDTHILIEGGPTDYFIFHPDGRAEELTLGTDVAARAEAVDRRAGWLLEFAPDRVSIGAGADWVKDHSGAVPWSTPADLRALIGPNRLP